MGKAPLYPGGQLIPQPVPIDPNESPAARRARAEALANGLIDRDSLLLFTGRGEGTTGFRRARGSVSTLIGSSCSIYITH